MSKLPSTKPKPPPWIPPGKGMHQYKKPSKPVVKKKTEGTVSPETSPNRTFDILKQDVRQAVDDDNTSISSHSPPEVQAEVDIHQVSVLREMKLFYTHFAAVKFSYISLYRLIDSRNVEDSSIREMLDDAGIIVKRLNGLFDDLEYSVSVLENTLNENQKRVEYIAVFRIKEKLLSELFEMYDKVILIFQTVFEKQDFKGLLQEYESLHQKLKKAEKEYISQEAVIKDLERRLSINLSKINTFESYKTNLESAKTDLERQLLQKESQIKYLSNELMNATGKIMKSDREDLIEMIESIKSEAHSKKSALKKVLKFQKGQIEENKEKIEKLLQELSEKEETILNLASQRDQLKVQLTVLNNTVIQQKTEIEEIKIQNLKAKNQWSEKEVSTNEEISKLKRDLEEKSSKLSKLLKSKENLEATVEELENELTKSKKQIKTLKEETNVSKSKDLNETLKTDALYEEIHRLVSLLQNTKEVFENLKQSVSSTKNNISNDSELDGIQNEILYAVKETKKELLELRNLYQVLLQEPKEMPEQGDISNRNDFEKQFKKMQHLYNTAMKENQALKQEVEELKNSSLRSPTVRKSENFNSNLSHDKVARQLQMELEKEKNDEILKLKYEFMEKERDLENQLRSCKDKLRAAEEDSTKVLKLEEELKNTKLELSFLQKKKDDETERLLQRNKELQDSLDSKIADYAILKNYVELLKSSYKNVFGDSLTVFQS